MANTFAIEYALALTDVPGRENVSENSPAVEVCVELQDPVSSNRD